MSAVTAILALLALLQLGSPRFENHSAANFQPILANAHPAPATLPQALRVVSFNVHYAQDPLQLAENIRQSEEVGRADVFLIQEAEYYPAEQDNRAAKIAQALGLNCVYAPARDTETGGTHGLAILSRYPLRDVEIIPLPQYDLHFRTRRRIALAATVDVGPVPLRIYNLHLDTRLNSGDRKEQLRPVLDRAHAEAIPRVIVGGDFNVAPFRWLARVVPLYRSNQAKTIDRLMQEKGFETRLARAGPTSRRGFFRFRLDTIYTRGLKVRASGIDYRVDGSDHVPVWVEVVWP